MNFSKFRQTGELSDMTVVVDDTEFHLHKFPLYAKSDFFCELTKGSNTECNRVELKEFPGGSDAFAVVADFCYNMRVDLTKTNIVHIRCAAEVLQMTGAGNLAELSEKCLHDTITSAKMSRSAAIIASLLFSCTNAAIIAEKLSIVTLCCEALAECWLKPPTKFSRPSSPMKGPERSDDSIKFLLGIPVAWLVELINVVRTRKVNNYILAEIMTKYIIHVIEKCESDKKGISVNEQNKAYINASKSGFTDNRSSHNDFDLAEDTKHGLNVKPNFDNGQVIDTILNELSDDTFGEECVTIEWVTKVLKFSKEHGCKCRQTLVKVAADKLNSLTVEDLCIISPTVLKDIVSDSSNGDATQKQTASQLVVNYMSEMARKHVLTAQTYQSLVASRPGDFWKSHNDSLYGILEYVLNAEKNKMTPEQRSQLLETVNFSDLGEATLKMAFNTEVVPASYVAKGALALCAKLKSELESAKNTVMKQEEELQRLRMTKMITSPMASLSKKSDSNNSSCTEPSVRDTANIDVPHPPVVLSLDVPSSSLGYQSESTTEDMITNARTKLGEAVATYSAFRPLSFDPECTIDDDTNFKYNRHVRSYDNARSKIHRSTNFRSAYMHPHRM